MSRKSRIIVLTWTGPPATGLVVADNYADNGPNSPIIIYLGGANASSVTMDTTGVTTGAPTFDLSSYGSNDISAWPAITSHFQDHMITAQAKNVVQTVTLNRNPRALKLLLDINTASLAAGEVVKATIFIDAEDN